MGADEVVQQQEKVLRALEALKGASDDIETNPRVFADGLSAGLSPFVKALLALQSAAADLLSRIKSFATSYSPSSLLRLSARREISRFAASISSEIDCWINREFLHRLTSLLHCPPSSVDEEDEAVRLLLALESRVSRGFDRSLQHALLYFAALPAIESALASPATSARVHDRCAAVVLALVQFNKDVFVGEVMMGPEVGCLVAMGSAAALRTLAGLIAAIRSPLVDELLAKGDIPRILAFLSSTEPEVQILAFDCVLEIGYFGRKDAIDAMMEAAVVKQLMELQRSELGGGDQDADFTERRPFGSAVVRLAVAVEVGEGLRQQEKREFKLEVLRRVREAAADEVETATVAAEVLWGTNSW